MTQAKRPAAGFTLVEVLVALLLVAMGYDMLSMSASNLARVKSTLRRFSRADADALLEWVRTPRR